MMKILTPLKAIRAHCLDCCCESFNEVKLCTVTKCSLYPYSLGKNPNRKGIGNTNPPFAQKNTVSANDFEDNSDYEDKYTAGISKNEMYTAKSMIFDNEGQ